MPPRLVFPLERAAPTASSSEPQGHPNSHGAPVSPWQGARRPSGNLTPGHLCLGSLGCPGSHQTETPGSSSLLSKSTSATSHCRARVLGEPSACTAAFPARVTDTSVHGISLQAAARAGPHSSAHRASVNVCRSCTQAGQGGLAWWLCFGKFTHLPHVSGQKAADVCGGREGVSADPAETPVSAPVGGRGPAGTASTCRGLHHLPPTGTASPAPSPIPPPHRAHLFLAHGADLRPSPGFLLLPRWAVRGACSLSPMLPGGQARLALHPALLSVCVPLGCGHPAPGARCPARPPLPGTWLSLGFGCCVESGRAACVARLWFTTAQPSPRACRRLWFGEWKMQKRCGGLGSAQGGTVAFVGSADAWPRPVYRRGNYSENVETSDQRRHMWR